MPLEDPEVFLLKGVSTQSPRPEVTRKEDGFATQAMVEFTCFALQPKAEAAPGPRVRGIDPPTLPSLGEPELLVGIVTAAESDLARAVVPQHALGHLHREEGAERQIVKPFVVRQFVNDRAAMPQDPKLRCSRDVVDIVNARGATPRVQRQAGSMPE